MEFVNNEDISRAGVDDLLEVVAMNRATDAGHDAPVAQSHIGLSSLPLAEVEAKSEKS